MFEAASVKADPGLEPKSVLKGPGIFDKAD